MTTGNDRIVVQNRIDFVTGAVRRYLADADALTAIAGEVQALDRESRRRRAAQRARRGRVVSAAHARPHDRLRARPP